MLSFSFVIFLGSDRWAAAASIKRIGRKIEKRKKKIFWSFKLWRFVVHQIIGNYYCGSHFDHYDLILHLSQKISQMPFPSYFDPDPSRIPSIIKNTGAFWLFGWVLLACFLVKWVCAPGANQQDWDKLSLANHGRCFCPNFEMYLNI